MDNMQAIERFSRLEASITLAAQACHRSAGTPQALNDKLSAVEHQAHEVRRLVQDASGEEAQDPAQLFECADRLKQLADEAANLSAQADGEVRRQVEAMREQVAHFRRDLHGTGMRREARPSMRPGAQG
jgi:chromosome segregation ATPase